MDSSNARRRDMKSRSDKFRVTSRLFLSMAKEVLREPVSHLTFSPHFIVKRESNFVLLHKKPTTEKHSISYAIEAGRVSDVHPCTRLAPPIVLSFLSLSRPPAADE